MQRRTVIETGLLQTWDLHKGVVLGAYHQENTRKKAEVEKDVFYFQEGNGQKQKSGRTQVVCHTGRDPGLRQSAQWVI